MPFRKYVWWNVDNPANGLYLGDDYWAMATGGVNGDSSGDVTRPNPVPVNWYGTDYDDSGWSDTAAGTDSATDFINMAWDDGFPQSPSPTDVPSGLHGIWPTSAPGTSSTNTQQSLFRTSIIFPDEKIVSLLFNVYQTQFRYYRFHNDNSVLFELGLPSRFGPYIFANGLQLAPIAGPSDGDYWLTASDTEGVVDLRRGDTNLFAIWQGGPVPVTLPIPPLADAGGGSDGQIWQGEPGIAWRVELTTTVPFIFPVPSSGPTLVAAGGSSFMRGPLVVDSTSNYDTRTWPSRTGTHTDTDFNTIPDEPQSGGFANTDIQLTLSIDTDAIAQGFVAEWTTITWIALNNQRGRSPTGLAPFWPTGEVMYCELYDDGDGLPGTLVGSASIVMDDAFLPSFQARLLFYFDPVVTVIPGNVYWALFRTSHGIYATTTEVQPVFCAAAYPCAPLPPVGVDNLAYGNSNNGQMCMYRTTMAPFWNFFGSGSSICTELQQPFEQVWQISIGGEGMVASVNGFLMSAPPAGDATGGYRDLNIDVMDSIPNVWPDYGWSEIQLGQPGDLSQQFIGSIPEIYVGDDGRPGAIAMVTEFDQSTGDFTGFDWGPVPIDKPIYDRFPWVGRSGWGLVTGWVFSGTSFIGPNLQRRPDGSFLFFDNALSDPDPANPPNGTLARLWFQLLSGDDPDTASYSDVTKIEPINPALNYNSWGFVIDSDSIAHCFFSDAVITHPYPLSPTFTTTTRTIYHLAIAPDGTMGPAYGWDCLANVSLPVGSGTQHPEGGVAFPYQNTYGDWLIAHWPSELTGTAVVIEVLPKVDPVTTLVDFPPFGSFPVVTEPAIPDQTLSFGATVHSKYTGNDISMGPSSPGSLAYWGGTGYLFVIDGYGVRVCRQEDGVWKGPTPAYYRTDQNGETYYPQTVYARYVPERDSIAVLTSNGKRGASRFVGDTYWCWLDWFSDGLSYSDPVPYETTIGPCTTAIIKAGAQVIG